MKPLHNRFILNTHLEPHIGAFGVQNSIHMDAYTFIQINQSRILNIDGCLTDSANVTIQKSDGRLAFYYFVDGKLVDSKTTESAR